jgi:outer membrane protein assembly factor BamB
VVVGGGYAFVRDWTGPQIIFDAATGATVGTFSATAPPVVAGPGLAFFLDNGTLSAIGPKTSKLLWEFKGDGSLATPPVVVDHWVVVASSAGNLYVLNSTTGAVAFTTKFSGTLGETLGAGGAMILVPAGNTLIALGSTT